MKNAAGNGTFDAIFVGAGINGLVGAALLAQKGWKVLVLERSDWLGGAIRTVTTDAGFVTELMACWHPQFLGSPGYRALRRDLERHGLQYVNTDVPIAVVTPDGQSLALTTDHAANVGEFNRRHTGEGRAWARAVKTFAAEASDVLGIRERSPLSAATAASIIGILRRRGRVGSLKMAGSMLEAARNWLCENFNDPMTHALLAPWSLHGSGGPDAPGSALVVRAVAAFSEMGGSALPVGGGKRLPEALAAIIKEAGGSCLTGIHVDQVIIQRGRAQGVRAGRSEWHCTRGVACSVSPQQLYSELLANEMVDEDLREQARKFRPGLANLQIALSLKHPLVWPGSSNLSRAAVIHVTEGLNGVSKAVNEAMRGLLPSEPTICVGQPMAVDPSRGPRGTSQLWLQLLELPSTPIGDAAGEIEVSGAWTEEVRDAFADRVIRRLGKIVPELSNAIIERIVLSPIDLEQENINLIGGSSTSGAVDLDQILMFRPTPSLRTPLTPFKGLYHIGASTHPGPSLAGTSGYIVAKLMSSKIKKVVDLFI